MRFLAMTAAALALGAAPALAATGTTSTPAGPSMAPSGITGQANNESPSGMSATQNRGNMPSAEIQQHIRHELSQAGFTDIHIMPQSFLVNAKDSAGNPVYMAISPNSMTALTLHRTANQSASNSPSSAMGTNGSSGSWGTNHSNSAMGSSTMQHSAQAGSAINSPNGNGTTVH